MPTYIAPGDWHLPYVREAELYLGVDGNGRPNSGDVELCKKISTARCARVSYLTHEGKPNVSADLRIHDQLAATASLGADPMHASPFEHPAMAVGGRARIGNFEGWKQYRKFFDHEAGPDTSDRCEACGAWDGCHVNGCPHV
jgi:hypothetical protein